MTPKLAARVAFAVAALGWAPSASAAPPEPALQGCWDVAVSTPVFVPTLHLRLKLAVRETSVSGTMSRGRWQAPLRSTAADGKRVRFVVDSPKGEARFTGTLDGASLRGSVRASHRTFSWQGRRCGG